MKLHAYAAATSAAALLLALGAPAFAQDEASEEPTIEVSVPNGTSLEDAIAALPETVEIHGAEAPVRWTPSEYVTTARGGPGRPVPQPYLPTTRGTYEFTGALVRSGEAMGLPNAVKANVNVESGGLVSLDDEELFGQPGEYGTETMTFGETERTYQYYIPSSYDGSAPVPVMFTFHGGGSYAVGQLSYSDFDEVAEEEGFIVIAPDYGASALGRFMEPGVAEFTGAILDQLEAEYTIDARRVYASGISMGGGASFTLAHELADRIAAVAPVATSGGGLTEREMPRPMTIVWFYGTLDSGYGPGFYENVGHLVEQITGSADTKPAVEVITPTEDDPTGVTRFHYEGRNGADLYVYRIDGGGHTWPGKYQYSSLINVGPTTQHIDASRIIWELLSQHQLPE